MRASIFELRAPRDAPGHEQKERRFAVVVQATRLEHISTWAVVPTTSSPNVRPGLLHPMINWGAGDSLVLCEAVQSVDPERRLAKEVGLATFSQMQEIDRALKFLLDLP